MKNLSDNFSESWSKDDVCKVINIGQDLCSVKEKKVAMSVVKGLTINHTKGKHLFIAAAPVVK